MRDNREVWQRGPVEGVPPLLQPVAHALLQAVEDVSRYTADLPPERLWERPAAIASTGFHLMHISGVIDRLFTYARGESLTPEQMKALAAEKEVPARPVSAALLVENIRSVVDDALRQLRETPTEMLTDARTIGRQKLPTTVCGLLFHAAEHAQRHVGQLLVTVRIVKEKQGP